MRDPDFTNLRSQAGIRSFGTILYRGACIGSGIIALCVVAGILMNMGHENGAAIVRTLTLAAVAWGAGRTALHFFN